MNLTNALKELIVDRFKAGEPIHKIALWYGQKPEKIEGVIRQAMQLQDVYIRTVKMTEKELTDGRYSCLEGTRKPDAA